MSRCWDATSDIDELKAEIRRLKASTTSKAGGRADASSVRRFREAALAPNTRRAYAAGWKRWSDACERLGIDADAPSGEQAARALAALGTRYSVSTVQIACAALRRRWRSRSGKSPLESEEAREVMAGLLRIRGGTPRQAKALLAADVLAMIEACPPSLAGLRTRALLAAGFSAALRQSELVGLDVSDIDFSPEGDRMRILVRRSKTDQAGAGAVVAVPNGQSIRPVCRLSAWLAASGIRRGPALQTLGRAGVPTGRRLDASEASRLVKRMAAKAGLDPAGYSSHSLRAGFVTSAAKAGARLDKIMAVTRHKSAEMVLRYVRDADAFDDHAGTSFL